MSALTLQEVERIAALARIELTSDEKALFARQLAEILTYAEQLQQVDTSNVPETTQMHPQLQAEREDEPVPSLSVDDAVTNAPDADRDQGLFTVPRVIGE